MKEISSDDRLAVFESATKRQELRNRRYRLDTVAVQSEVSESAGDQRGWTREELYDRDRTR